jgi:hypothetical protein
MHLPKSPQINTIDLLKDKSSIISSLEITLCHDKQNNQINVYLNQFLNNTGSYFDLNRD